MARKRAPEDVTIFGCAENPALCDLYAAMYANSWLVNRDVHDARAKRRRRDRASVFVSAAQQALAHTLVRRATAARPRVAHVPVRVLRSQIDGCLRLFGASDDESADGPLPRELAARVTSMLAEHWGVSELDVAFVFHRSAHARASLARFVAYVDALPPDAREVWFMFHGVRSRPSGDASRFTSATTRTTALDPAAAHKTHNRLGAGLYFASHASYNLSRGFFEVCDDGALGVLLCWVAPGRARDVGLGACPEATASPPGYHSRRAQASARDGATIVCVDHAVAVHVLAEAYVRGARVSENADAPREQKLSIE